MPLRASAGFSLLPSSARGAMSPVRLMRSRSPWSNVRYSLPASSMMLTSMRPIAGSARPFICAMTALCAGSLLSGNASLR